MEQEPFGLLSPEDDKDKKDKRKKRDRFTVPLPLSEGEKSKNEKPEKPEPTPLDKAVAELALKKREEAAKRKAGEEVSVKKPEKPEQPEPAAAEDSAIAAAREKLAEANDGATDDTGESEKLESYKLPPTDLSGGEVIIHLQGDKTREERVMPLRAEDESEPTENEPPAETSAPAEAAPEEPAETLAAEIDSEPAPTAPEAAPGSGGDIPPTEPPETGVSAGDGPEPPERPATSPAGSRESAPPAAFFGAAPAVEAPANPGFSPLPEAVRTAEFVSPADGVGTSAPHSERTDANYATKRELEDAVYTATREGQNRGVLAGLVAGGAYEHFKHKRREKRQARRMKEQAKQLNTLQEQQAWQVRQHEREVEQLKHVSPRAEVSNPPAPAEISQAFTESGPIPLPNRQESVLASVGRPEIAWQSRPIEQIRVHGAESSSGADEALPGQGWAEKGHEERPRPVGASAAPEQLEIPPEHRLQSSAWHSIEIDSRTGKPVENPVFEYGHEYYRERSQESAPRRDIDNAAGEAALVAEALSATTDAPGGRDSANQPMLPPSATTHVTPQTFVRERAKKARTSRQSTSPLWPYVLAFVIVVILLVAVLR